MITIQTIARLRHSKVYRKNAMSEVAGAELREKLKII